MELKHRLLVNGEIETEPVYMIISPRYSMTRKIFSINIGSLDHAPHYYYALDDDVKNKDFWEETNDNAYISTPFSVPKKCTFQLPIDDIDIQQHTDGWGQFLTSSPHYGELWYHKGFPAKINRKAGDTVTLLSGEQYYVITKNKQLLTNLTFKIHISDKDLSIIDEPIGFDNLKMTMKRGEYHGMSAEVSELSLEFYGTAADIVRTAYQTDLDTELTYLVTADGEEMYRGVLDLSTYEEQHSDYCSVSCKVGEVGVKTTFNNRAETEVDLNATQTLDGKNIAHNYSWNKITIPQKHIRYTNMSNRKTDETITTSGGYNSHPETGIEISDSAPYIFLPITNDETYSEFGTIEEKPSYTTDDISNIEPQYISEDNHNEKYGIGTKTKIEIKLIATITRMNGGWSPVGKNYIKWFLVAVDNFGNKIQGEEKKVYKPDVNEKGSTWDLSCELKGELRAEGSIKYYLEFNIDLGDASAQYFFAHIKIQKGSYIKMKMYDNLPDTQVSADTLFVHEALNKISEIISENTLTVKSDLYSRFDSTVNRHTATSDDNEAYEHYFGNSALKVITNGYKIRGLFSTDDTERNMPLSFKGIIEALNAIDCIGWGFVNEDSETFVRVERWSWFYQSDTILRISNPNEIKREIDTSLIITEMTIGYKKYSTSDDIASIDSIMSERTFTTTTKAINNATNKLCEFIADNYAIELTRRSATNKKADEEFKYDENTFIFSLSAKINTQGIAAYTIDTDIEEADTSIERSEETYNAKLSPARCAYHWIDRLFCVAGIKPFVCTSGTINYSAHIRTKGSTTDGTTTTLRMTDNVNTIPAYTQILPGGSKVNNIKQNAENYTLRERYYKTYQLDSTGTENTPIPSSDDMIIPRVFKAETLSFTYPLTIAQYKAIKANPYGLIEVDGIQGWIKEFSYSFADGEATFKLIPKAD